MAKKMPPDRLKNRIASRSDPINYGNVYGDKPVNRHDRRAEAKLAAAKAKPNKEVNK